MLLPPPPPKWLTPCPAPSPLGAHTPEQVSYDAAVDSNWCKYDNPWSSLFVSCL